MSADLVAVLDRIPPERVPAALAHLAARLLRTPPAPPASAALLTPADVAARLRTHRKWVYRHADELGGVRLADRTLRFPAEAVDRFVARRRR